MVNKMYYLLGLLVAILGSLFGTSSVEAATGPQTGFVTLSNPETGQEIAAWCTDGRIDSIAVLSGGEAYPTDVSVGTPCSPTAFPGFLPVVNIDPRDGGWMIIQTGDDEPKMALACTYDGVAFALKYGNQPLYVYSRKGDCGPGVYPG